VESEAEESNSEEVSSCSDSEDSFVVPDDYEDHFSSEVICSLDGRNMLEFRRRERKPQTS
jgi:hypothetical protein